MTERLYVGYQASALGTYIMNNSGATLLVNGNEYEGYLATGSAGQSGGTFTQYAGTPRSLAFSTMVLMAAAPARLTCWVAA